MVSIERQELVARQAIDSSIDDLALQQELVAVWDESAARLVPEVREMSWLHDNIGIWLNLVFKHDQVFIVDSRDRAVYASRGGKMVDAGHYEPLKPDLEALLEPLRRPQGLNGKHDRNPNKPLSRDASVRTTSRATHDSHLMLVGGRPAIASAMLIKPSTPGYVRPVGPWPALISVRYLDTTFLMDLANRESLAGARLSLRADLTAGEHRLLLRTEGGSAVAYLFWKPDLPGSRVAARLYPTSLAFLCVTVILMLFLARRLRKALLEAAASAKESEHLALNDFLTGLPNRRFFQRALEASCAAASTGSRNALILFDLDNFKITNDTEGHDAGDALLKAMASRLISTATEHDIVARLGGDEFAFLISSAETTAELEARGRDLLALIRQPVPYRDKQVISRASAGGTILSAGVTSSDALKQADLALYTSKRDGRDTFRIYEPSMLSKVRVRNKMLQLARRVLEEGYVRPYFQPKVDLLSSRIVGFEALLRCGLPGGELFGPLRIAAALEDRRLATELSCRILDAVIEQMVIWRRAGLDFGHVAINASVSDLNQPAFASKLLQRVAAAGLEPGVIQIEITESVLLGRNASLVMKTLETLHDAGIKLALDDFGTGFASLSHLKLATIDIIKIDKTFVRNLHANDEDAAIVRALIEVAKALNLEVVTEGVETGDQCSLLAIAGCETGQGFYFSRPLPGEEITGLLASRVEAVAA